MTGKIRVSIVATALDGYKTENKTVLNMLKEIIAEIKVTLKIYFLKTQELKTMLLIQLMEQQL